MDRLAKAERLFLDALALQENGALEQAKRLYEEALAIAPKRPSVINNLAAVLIELKKFPEAALLCERLLEINPHDETALVNLGSCQLKQGAAGDALRSCEKALRFKPEYPEALNNLGSALLELKRPREALESCDHALALKPGYAEAHNNRGNILLALDRPEEALASYERALALVPNYVEALYNRGTGLLELRRPQEALESLDRALAMDPDYHDALYNRGHALRELKRLEEALASYDRAIQIKPDHADAFLGRGNILRDLKRPEEALASYDRALLLKPDNRHALYNRASTLRDSKRFEDAVQTYARLLELAPDYDFARGDLLLAKMACCDWNGLTKLVESIEKDIQAGKRSAEPFGYQAISRSPRNLKRCAEIYAAANYPRSSIRLWNGEKYRNTRIRIGYLSGEFRNQATSILMAELFELHDRKRFELIAFDNGWDDASEVRVRLNRAFDAIVDISRLGDLEAAETIRRRQIDILVDLNGYFGYARQGIFSLKPSPVQVNYLGFPGTSGADYMDYIIADRHVIPPEHEIFYTERVVYLPHTYQVNDSKRRIAERVPTRAEVKLPESGIVFCCFNNNYKITPDMFDIWMRLLKNVPDSVLWLLEDNVAATRNLRREATARGVAPARLIFAPRIKLEDHLARHKQADLFLDTLPYNAHTTASDTLWAGLPLLTCRGTTFPGRVATSLLNAVGLPETIACSLEEYEARALELATRPAMLAEIRGKLARNGQTHPLFNTDRFRRHIEAAYVTMWERAQRAEPPVSFVVPEQA